MNQSDVRNLAVAAEKSVSDAYWGTGLDEVKSCLMDLQVSINKLITMLDQEDLESRTEAFNAATDLMRTQVLPGIKELDVSIEKIIQIEGVVKTALSDAMKLSQAVSFFQIPNVF
jgi:hypothetical protein